MKKYLNEYLQSLRLKGCSKKTIKYYGLLIKKYLDTTETPDDIHSVRSFLMQEESNNKQSTIATKINIFRSFFNWLEREKLIDENPMHRIEKPKIPQTSPKFLTHEEIELLREFITKLIDRTLFEVLYSSGIRVSEAVNLNWQNIDFNNKELQVIAGKGNKDRTTLLSTKAILHLKQYKKSRNDNDEWVFQSQYKQRMSKESIEQHMKALGEKAHLNKNLTPHRLRHSFATHLLEAGVPIDVVQKLLGHEDVSTTQVYAKTSQENIKHFHKKVFP
jgi:integrase/recombinase XerD